MYWSKITIERRWPFEEALSPPRAHEQQTFCDSSSVNIVHERSAAFHNCSCTVIMKKPLRILRPRTGTLGSYTYIKKNQNLQKFNYFPFRTVFSFKQRIHLETVIFCCGQKLFLITLQAGQMSLTMPACMAFHRRVRVGQNEVKRDWLLAWGSFREVQQKFSSFTFEIVSFKFSFNFSFLTKIQAPRRLWPCICSNVRDIRLNVQDISIMSGAVWTNPPSERR